MTEVLREERPDWVLIQGDTTTVRATALAAFYLDIPVGHIKAGLRTMDRYSPFPEEINHRIVTGLATYHFAPTKRPQERLIAERVDLKSVFLTGNTTVDALQWILKLPVSEEAKGVFADLGLREPAVARELIWSVQRWQDTWNFFRSHFGRGMGGRTPSEVFKERSGGASHILQFPVVLLEALLRKVNPKLLTFPFHLKTGTDVFTLYRFKADEASGCKVLFVVTIYTHFAAFHIPCMELLQRWDYEVHAAASPAEGHKDEVEAMGVRCWDISFVRLPVSAKNLFFVHGVGMDLERFSQGCEKVSSIRKKLGLGDQDVVVNCVGEFTYTKNHAFLAPPKDPNALAQATLRVMEIPEEERRAMGKAARNHIEANFNLDRVVEQWEALYRELLAKKGIHVG